MSLNLQSVPASPLARLSRRQRAMCNTYLAGRTKLRSFVRLEIPFSLALAASGRDAPGDALRLLLRLDATMYHPRHMLRPCRPGKSPWATSTPVPNGGRPTRPPVSHRQPPAPLRTSTLKPKGWIHLRRAAWTENPACTALITEPRDASKRNTPKGVSLRCHKAPLAQCRLARHTLHPRSPRDAWCRAPTATPTSQYAQNCVNPLSANRLPPLHLPRRTRRNTAFIVAHQPD